MLEVNNDFFTTTDAQHALQELYKTRFDAKTATNLCKIKKEFDKLFKEISIKGQAIMFKYAELDENKKFIADRENEHGIKFKPGMYAQAQKEISEFLNTKITIPHINPIPRGLISEISVLSLEALNPVLEKEKSLELVN